MYSCGSYPLMLSAFVCAMIAVAGAVVALSTPRWYVVDTQGNGRKEFSLFEICDQFSPPNNTTAAETTTTLLPTVAPPYTAPVGTCSSYTSTSPFQFVTQFTFRTTVATSPPAPGQPTLPPSPYICPVSGEDMNAYFLTTIALGSAGVFMAGCGMLTILMDCVRWCLMRSRVHRNIAKRKLRHAKRKKKERQQQAAISSSGGGGGASVMDVVIDFEEGGEITGSFEARVVDDRRVSILTIIATIFFGLANVLLVAAIGYFASVFDNGKPFCDGVYGDACDLLRLYDDDAYHFSECEAFYGYSYSLAILSWVASLCALSLLIARIISVICCRITNINEDDLDDASTSDEEELGELQQEMIGTSTLSTPPRPGTTRATETEDAAAKKKGAKDRKAAEEEEERYNIAAAKEHQNKQFNPIDMYRQAHHDEEDNDQNGGGLAVLTTGARPVEEDDDIDDLELDFPGDADNDLDLGASQKQQHRPHLHTPAPRGGGRRASSSSAQAVVIEGPVNVSGAPKHPGEPDVVELPDGRWEWDEEAELFWNEEQEYFFDHQSEQFYDPDTEQWYNRKTGKWYSL